VAALDWANVERLLKVLAGLTLSLYVIGLLSINGYLFHLGTSDFSLVRPRFIYTGALIAFFYAISCLSSLYAVRRWYLYKPWHDKDRGRMSLSGHIRHVRKVLGYWIDILASLLFPPMVYFTFLFITHIGPEYLRWTSLIRPIIIYVTGLIVTFVSITVLRVSSKSTQLSGTYRVYYLFSWYINIVLWAAVYAAVFMGAIFPVVPEQFGGGEPKEVRLVLKQDSTKGATEVGILDTSQTQITGLMSLIYEGSDKYVVRSPEGHIVTVDKQAVLFVETRA
jgi:hypothetical protein